MYLPKNLNLSTLSINNYYLPWLISFFVATTLKPKLHLVNSSNNVEVGIFVVNGNTNGFDKMKTDFSNNNCDEISYNGFNKSKQTVKSGFCCCNRNQGSSENLNEEGFGLLGNSKQVPKISMRDKERHASSDYAINSNHESIPDLSATASDCLSEPEASRISHIDRELPPIPKLVKVELKSSNMTSSIVEPEIASICESENYNELKPTDETDNDQPNFVSCGTSDFSREQLQSTTSSPKLDKFHRSSVECRNCCCSSRQDILSSDDLSSNDYDPTYAAIKRKKPSCPVCGVPSVYTPVNSNRNSNLSLQFNSCLTSPMRNAISQKPFLYDSLNNSTYASIAKLPKIIPETDLNMEYDNSGASTIKRQRSISQGDIIRSSLLKSHELQHGDMKTKETQSTKIENQKKNIKSQTVFNNPTMATISLWSLMASNRNSPYSMFPLIPERTYGQSVVDLIEKLRESEHPNRSIRQSSFGINDFGRSYTPPLLFKKGGSGIHLKSRVWTPPSCHMIHGNITSKSGLCSPLKLFDRNSNSYDFNFPDLIGSYRKSTQLFQPVLTPPLSPMDCLNFENEETCEMKQRITVQDLRKDNEIELIGQSDVSAIDDNENAAIQAASVYEDLDYDNILAVDNEIEVVNEKITSIVKTTDEEYLLNQDLDGINSQLKFIGYSDDAINPRTRPISIHLYGDDSLTPDKCLKYRFDKCEIFGFSSVQMSPLMEQSIENSSSKTTLSSLSFHQFNRLISSEDSCAKSPPSAELSPSLDNFEISSETSAFLYNDLMWSKINSAFDGYDTFE